MTSPVPTTDPLFPSQWQELAEGVCASYYEEFPEQDARYGDRGRAFCVHDNAYLIAWLVEAIEVAGSDSFRTNVEWLCGVLHARGFPMDAFRRNLELVGDAVAGLRPDDAPNIRDLVREAHAASPR